MRIQLFGWSIALVAIVASTSCTIDDEDRCPSGFFYVPEIESCCLEGHVYDPTNPLLCASPPPDAGVDSDSASDSDGIDGLGTECTDDSACAGLEASFCAVNPTTGSGYCTLLDCAAPDCPTGYQCCDCTASQAVAQEIACLTDDDATLVGGFGCTCE